MSVVIETTLGDITVDLFTKERPRACLNFLKLCKMKYFNYNLFHTISRGFIAQTGDPTGSRNGGESIFGVLEGPLKRYFEAERNPRMKHTTMGLVSFVGTGDHMIGSQFFVTLGNDLTYLDEQHCIFGEVMEGLDVLELLNESICDEDNRPYQDVRITHTVILDDPFPDPEKFRLPPRSPSPNAERLQGGRIAPDEEIDETQGKSMEEVNEIVAFKEAKARATILEMIGDIPDADMAPPENVLFVCKLNPVTNDDDLEILFSRFGKINSCEVIRDKKTSESLQYAFVEFNERKACEDAYFKMDNVLIDDRRIHVDFSQSVAKVKWHGKGRGVTTYDDKGKKAADSRNNLGNGKYKRITDNNKTTYSRSFDRYSNKGDEHIENKRYDKENNRTERSHRRDFDYRDNSRNTSYERRDRSYDQTRRREPSQKYSNRYEEHKPRSKRDDRFYERDDNRNKQCRSRSRSKDNYRDNKRKGNVTNRTEKYECKSAGNIKKDRSETNPKHSKAKKKHYSSSSEDTSTEDSESSDSDSDSSERSKYDKKHKKKHDRSRKEGNKTRKPKKKTKKKRCSSNSSEES